MRNIIRFVAVAGVVFASWSAHAGGALEVKVAPPRKGEVADVVSRVSQDMHGTMNGRKVAQSSVLDESWTQELLAVDKDVVTKERVSFTAAHEKAGGDATKDEDLLILKKTYVATAADGKISFTDANGGKVDDAELELLAKTIDNVGAPDKMGALFGGKEFSKGVAVPLSSADLAVLMGANDQFPASNLTLTLVDNDGKRARFAIAGTMDGDQHGMHLSATFSGSTTFDLARGRILEMDVSTQVKVTAAKGKVSTEIDMKASGHRSATYR